MKKKVVLSALSIFLLSVGFGSTGFASCTGNSVGTDACYTKKPSSENNNCRGYFTWSTSREQNVYCEDLGAKNDNKQPVCSGGNDTC